MRELADLIIREAGLADAVALFDAHQDSVFNLCAGAYSEQHMRVWFAGRSPAIYQPALEARQIWLAEQGNRILGFVGFVPGEITLLFVRPEVTGSGLSARLLALGAEKAESGCSGFLTVIATQNSQRFYQRHGFIPVAEEFFARGEPEMHFNVVRMQRPIRTASGENGGGPPSSGNAE